MAQSITKDTGTQQEVSLDTTLETLKTAAGSEIERLVAQKEQGAEALEAGIAKLREELGLNGIDEKIAEASELYTTVSKGQQHPLAPKAKRGKGGTRSSSGSGSGEPRERKIGEKMLTTGVAQLLMRVLAAAKLVGFPSLTPTTITNAATFWHPEYGNRHTVALLIQNGCFAKIDGTSRVGITEIGEMALTDQELTVGKSEHGFSTIPSVAVMAKDADFKALLAEDANVGKRAKSESSVEA